MIKDKTTSERETFELALPDEPPVGSVVLDRYGRAWQRLAGGLLSGANWHVTGQLTALIPELADAPKLPWGNLLLQRGELTLLYIPEESK